MTARRAMLVLWACAACGDNAPPGEADVFAATSGARLSLQKYRYDDGTEQTVAGEFYDLQLHTRCTPLAWSDGALRCVPVADDAVFSDAGCTALVGVARTIAKPTRFIVHDTGPAGRVVARVVQAGGAAAPVSQFWEPAGGACVGPTPLAPGPGMVTFFTVGDDVDPGSLVELHDREVGDGRLGLVVRESDDGMRVLAGLHDRELDADCAPAVQDDGSVACEPTAAAPASLFVDPGCGEPVIATTSAPPPALARRAEPSGCARYYRVGREMAPPLYRRDGDACMPVDAPVDGRLFALDAPVALAPLGRSLAPTAGRRLARVLLDPGLASGLRFADDRLYDPELGTDCRPRNLRNALRCIPVTAAPAATLFLDGCTTQAAVAALPRHSCEPLGFATTNRPFQIRTIGAATAAAVFGFSGGVCLPVTTTPDTELRALGPPIDLTAFVEAIYFGERAP